MAVKRMIIEVWVCPTEGCPDFFGAAGAGDLTQKFAYPKVEHVLDHEQRTGQRHRHTRAECPTCRVARKLSVERVLLRLPVSVPMSEANAA